MKALLSMFARRICGRVNRMSPRVGLPLVALRRFAVQGAITIAAILLAASWSHAAERQGGAARFVVAPGGDDTNPGTREKPFATVARAQKAVRAVVAAGLSDDVTVLLRGGTYELANTLVFGPEDSGTEEFAVTYTAFHGETVRLSGGRRVGPWRRGDDGVWTANVPGVKQGGRCPRLLIVGGRRAIRARTPNVDAKPNCWQMKSASLSKDLHRYTITMPPGLVKNWRNIGDVEVMAAGNWAINRKRLSSVDEKTGTVVLAPPHSLGHGAIHPKSGRWCYFENALEMLDQPGEWYLDRTTGVLHYRPRPGEDMTRVETVMPVLVRLVEVRGTADRPVRNLHFRGIAFEHTDWQLPAIGYMGIQACHHNRADRWQRPWARVPAAIRFDDARECSLQDGRVAHCGGCGIELVARCRDNVVEGNHVFDCSGNGIMVGTSVPDADVSTGNRVSNNHVEACGREYYGAVGIWVGFAEKTLVAHNLVHGLPYSGISVGWQWNPQPTPCKENTVEANHVYDVMNRLCDGGCLYTLGFQPGTVIRANHFHDAHRSVFAQGAPNNGMFIDEGSKGFLFERNVIYNTAAKMVRFNQCQRDWHTWRDNHFGPAAEVKKSGAKIIAEAGLEPAYRQRLAGGNR